MCWLQTAQETFPNLGSSPAFIIARKEAQKLFEDVINYSEASNKIEWTAVAVSESERQLRLICSEQHLVGLLKNFGRYCLLSMFFVSYKLGYSQH